MKILLIGPLPPLRGGISDFNKELLKNLIRTSDVHALSFKYLYPKYIFPGKRQFKNVVDDNLKIKKINPYNPISYLIALNYIIDLKPDKIISTHWNPLFSLSYSIINFFSSKKIEKIGLMHNLKSHEDGLLDSFFLSLYFGSLDKVICLSDFTHKKIGNFFNCKSVSLFHPIPKLNQLCIDRDKALTKKKFDPKKKYLLHFGLVRKYKGLDILLTAFKKVIEKNKTIHLIVAGEFYENIKKYENLIGDLKLQNHVTIENEFIPEKDIYKWFSMADYIIQTNTRATQSGITALSIFFEKIMISTASGGIKETLNEKNSFICEKDPKSIALKILEAFETKNDKKILEIKKLKNKLSWDKFSNDLLNFIK